MSKAPVFIDLVVADSAERLGCGQGAVEVFSRILFTWAVAMFFEKLPFSPAAPNIILCNKFKTAVRLWSIPQIIRFL